MVHMRHPDVLWRRERSSRGKKSTKVILWPPYSRGKQNQLPLHCTWSATGRKGKMYPGRTGTMYLVCPSIGGQTGYIVPSLPRQYGDIVPGLPCSGAHVPPPQYVWVSQVYHFS